MTWCILLLRSKRANTQTPLLCGSAAQKRQQQWRTTYIWAALKFSSAQKLLSEVSSPVASSRGIVSVKWEQHPTGTIVIPAQFRTSRCSVANASYGEKGETYSCWDLLGSKSEVPDDRQGGNSLLWKSKAKTLIKRLQSAEEDADLIHPKQELTSLIWLNLVSVRAKHFNETPLSAKQGRAS